MVQIMFDILVKISEVIVARKISLGKMLPGNLSPSKGEHKNLGLIVSVTIVDKGDGGVGGSIGDDE